MRPITISKFGGIAPIFEGHVKPGTALVAQDCDLSSGKVRPLQDNLLVQSGVYSPCDSLIEYQGKWLTGTDKFYLEITEGESDILLFLESGIPMKTVGGATVALGQAIPEPPIITNLTTDTVLTSSVYEWTASKLKNNIYYCQLAGAGGDPGLVQPAEVVIDGIVAVNGTVSKALSDHQWAYGDASVDALGYNTVYVSFGDAVSNHVIDHLVNPGNVNGTVNYLICTDRTVSGMIDKSGPSSATSALAAVFYQVQITAPTFTDPNATNWYIYRISSNTGVFQLVAMLPVSTTTYIDNIADADLGAALDTEYTGSQTGVTITYSPPDTPFDGIANALYNGILFAWRGSTLFWCEPGKFDSWPPVYQLTMEKPIKVVVVGILFAVVLCEDGCYLIQGTDAELIYASTHLGAECCISVKAFPTSRGIVYVTEGGLAIATISNVSVITDTAFGRKWWNENIQSVNFLAEIDRRLIVATPTMILVLEASMAPDLQWMTLSDIFYAAWKNPADGFLYVVDAQGIKKFTGSSNLLSSCTWQSGKLYGDRPVEKTFDAVLMRGTGSVNLSASLDGNPTNSKTINLDSLTDRDKQMKFPEQNSAKYCQAGWTGSGLVDDLTVTFMEDS